MRRRLGRNDWIFIGTLLLICVGILVGFGIWNHEEGSRIVITRDGEVYGTYPLSQDCRIEIADEDGTVTNILVIQDGKAKMSEADCKDKLCMHQKAISLQNENIVCLPNRIVVTVTDAVSGGYDGFAQ